MDLDQDPQDEIETQDHLKWSHTEESSATQKKSKIAKVLEKNFMESSQPIRNITTSTFPELIIAQKNVLGEIKAQLQGLKT